MAYSHSAAGAGTTAAQISRLENNERPGASAVILGSVAVAMGTTVEYLLGQTHDPVRPTPSPRRPEDELSPAIRARIQQVVTRTAALPPDSQRRIFDALLLLLEVHESLATQEDVLPERGDSA